MLLTIGLEIHIKLKSENKMFCQCKNEQNFENLQANTNICPVCTGQPGALPTLSEEVLRKALILGKALNCEINNPSQFDRKSYFYPDLPMGYQITQLYKPTNVKGKVSFFVDNEYSQERTIHIQDAHMESDTGKMIHQGGEALLDFNRAGTPLVEIVTLPDFTSADEVVEFLKELQRIVRYNNIADADMEKGQMRCDVNISIREKESDPYGTRVEVKNMNSFAAIKRAIQYEYDRQSDLYNKGEKFDQQTRGRDDTKGESYLMRSKEDALDYRYFPEPDLPPLLLDDSTLQHLSASILEIPYRIIKKFKQEFGFHKEYINAIISDKETLDYFLDILSHCEKGNEKTNAPLIKGDLGGFAKLIAKRISGPISARMKENFKSINELNFTKDKFQQFLKIAQEGKILDNQLKIVMDEMIKTGKNPEEIIKEKGFDKPAIDNNELENIVKLVLQENPAIVEQYKGGKTTTLGFFVGQVMKKTGGKVDPKTVGDKIIKELS
ncbi:Asp-tRNA(Asn)/Glu-tRNA(Gln) amidotransferase subunit GatB [Candidatus Gracilibacteria bacterium]|nr:Asp-tRNA(Asn)/Glu-tRNA(Gln) amidotransferase subunit GatB [Candidatus Gracilibacteria bacterium]